MQDISNTSTQARQSALHAEMKAIEAAIDSKGSVRWSEFNKAQQSGSDTHAFKTVHLTADD